MVQQQPQHSPMSIGGGEEIKTIFISGGLPEDVKKRELQNLMRWLPGYEACQVNFKAEVPMGFALFSAPHFAIAARDALQVNFYILSFLYIFIIYFHKKGIRRAAVNTFGYIAKAIGPQDVLATLTISR